MAILKIPLWLRPQQKASPSAVWGWRDVGHGVGWLQMQCADSSLADSEASQQLSPGAGQEVGTEGFLESPGKPCPFLDQHPWEQETGEMKGCTVSLPRTKIYNSSAGMRLPYSPYWPLEQSGPRSDTVLLGDPSCVMPQGQCCPRLIPE